MAEEQHLEFAQARRVEPAQAVDEQAGALSVAHLAEEGEATDGRGGWRRWRRLVEGCRLPEVLDDTG